jgi:hypothetical protein
MKTLRENKNIEEDLSCATFTLSPTKSTEDVQASLP